MSSFFKRETEPHPDPINAITVQSVKHYLATDNKAGGQKHTQHDKGLLGRIRLDLLNGVSLVVDAVRQHTSETSTSEQGQAPGPSQESELLLGFGGRGGISVGPTGDALEGLLVVEAAISPQRWPGRTKDLAGGLEARQGREAHGGWGDHVGGGEVRWKG